jgi:lipoprotein-anchoring transpeptidase ErfK/SrfK
VPTRAEIRRRRAAEERNRRRRQYRRRRLVAGGLAVLAIVAVVVGVGAALRGDDDERPRLDASAASTTSAAPTTTTLAPFTSFVAEATVPTVQVFEAPGAPAPLHEFEHPVQHVDGDGNPYEVPLILLVDQQQDDWLNVLLPIRPNGSTGWIRAADVKLTPTTYHITVELGAHMITVYDSETIVLQEPIGVGVGNTPTPGGRYFIRQLLQTPNPDGVYGPYAYGLSGFSEVLEEFNGGPGDIGIHGTNEPGALGTDVSHGCIRMSNDGITRLAGLLPLGTPVEIVA